MRITLLLFFCCPTFLLNAQSSKTGNWFFYLGNNALSKKINLHTEAQYRNYNFAGDLQQFLGRVGVGYNLTENNNNILLGYAYILTENYAGLEKKSNVENRLFQQFISKQNFGRFYLQHRYRAEERWLANDVFKFRLRYALFLNVPITKKEMTAKAFYLATYNEIFMHTTGDAFDRNRLYGGLGYVFNKKYRVEVGYLSQRLQNSERGQTVITFFNSMPFFKNN